MISRALIDETIPQVEGIGGTSDSFVAVERHDFFGANYFPLWRWVQTVLKRVLDFAAASLALVVLSPLLVLVALLIVRDSDGPVIFRQRRMGRHGRLFWIYKFRTMVVDAERRQKSLEKLNESEGGALFKIWNDPRITPIGGFLRKTSIDELPQLMNVILGDMSLVGPRPLPQRDCARLVDINENRYHQRQEVLPGITGPWQVAGRSRLGAEQMLELDCQYVEEWSFFKDLVILFKTVGVVLGDRSSAC